MPLNVKNVQEALNEGRQIPQPILHRPKPDLAILKNLVITLIVVGSTASAVFLVVFFFFRSESKIIPAPLPDGEQIEAKKVIPSVPVSLPPTEEHNVNMMKDNPVTLNEAINYTIIIGTHASKEIAEEEAIRWRDAGYDALIVEDGNRSRVALGCYPSEQEARADAERMREMFEQGFLITLLK